MWDNREYSDLIPLLRDFREEQTSPSTRLRVDYMAATSMCRIAKYRDKGLVLIEQIPFVYRHISQYNHDIISEEHNNCKSGYSSVTRLAYEPPGVSGKGGKERYRQKDINESEMRFHKRLQEFDSRVITIKNNPRISNLDKFTSLVGEEFDAVVHEEFDAVVHKSFIVVGNMSVRELMDNARLLDEVLVRLMEQFDMDAPSLYTTVYLMPTSESMVEFAKSNHDIDIPATLWGYTFPYDSSIVINLSGSTGTYGHEVLHMLMNQDFPDSPPWLNEGYSALFEEYLTSNGEITGTYKDSHWRIKYLHSRPRMRARPSISDLIALDWYEFDASDNDRLHVNHTTSKFFAMYLQSMDKLDDVYDAFSNLDIRNAEDEILTLYTQTLEKSLCDTPIDKIERDFQEWLINDLGVPDIKQTSQKQ